MNRLWSLLFLLVPLGACGLFLAVAAGVGPFRGYWLPENFSEQGKTIDHLFDLIHVLAGVILLVTGTFLGIALWRFGDVGNPTDARRRERDYASSNRPLEITWSVIPGIILVFLAFYQYGAWAENKIDRPLLSTDKLEPPIARVVARQFSWEFYYAGADGLLGTQDDLYVENELVVPHNGTIVLRLESRDVIHSLFVPQLRLKQDIVPNLKLYCWFTPLDEAEMDIICSELCGPGHYRMKARLRIVSPSQFENWLEQLSQQQEVQAPRP